MSLGKILVNSRLEKVSIIAFNKSSCQTYVSQTRDVSKEMSERSCLLINRIRREKDDSFLCMWHEQSKLTEQNVAPHNTCNGNSDSVARGSWRCVCAKGLVGLKLIHQSQGYRIRFGNDIDMAAILHFWPHLFLLKIERNMWS